MTLLKDTREKRLLCCTTENMNFVLLYEIQNGREIPAGPKCYIGSAGSCKPVIRDWIFECVCVCLLRTGGSGPALKATFKTSVKG